MPPDADLDRRATRRAIVREVRLVEGAIALVASGGAPRVTVGGLAFGAQILAAGARRQAAAGAGARAVVARGRISARWRSGGCLRSPGAHGPVLLVDDDEAFVDLVGRQLDARGYQVVTAGSVEACRQLLDEGLRPAFAAAGHQPAGRDRLVAPARRTPKEAGSPPVVILSGTQIRPQRLREFGVAGYLPKPVPMALLTSCVARFTGDPDADSGPGPSEVFG